MSQPPKPPTAPLPLQLGNQGEAVRDLQRRLIGTVGAGIPASELGAFGDATRHAVERFQDERGLEVTGCCDRSTWSALVEAGYRLGDRLLYLRSPMLRGDDVAELQHRLGALGFDAGRVDGILGPDTEAAIRDFQRNMGITSDGVCGRDTLAALDRLRAPGANTASVRVARERERLRAAPRTLAGRRVVVGEFGGLDALLRSLRRTLQERGASVAAVHHPEPSQHAQEANEFEADLYLGIAAGDDSSCLACYFSVPGFESVGGRLLAERLAEHVPAALGHDRSHIEGKRLPVLRETRMPAVSCRLGPPDALVARAPAVVSALATAVQRWVEEPVET